MKMKSMARSGAEGNCRLLSKYGGGSSGPRQHYASGGVVKARADGGMVEEDDMGVEGEEAMPRLDKPSRKPKGESKTIVNVVIAGKDDSQGMPPLGGPPLGLPAGGPPGGLPVGGGPGGGMPPMPMRKHGGRVTKAEGGGVLETIKTVGSALIPGAALGAGARAAAKVAAKAVADKKKSDGLPERAKGGVVMEDGAGSAEGRLEKVRKYGK